MKILNNPRKQPGDKDVVDELEDALRFGDDCNCGETTEFALPTPHQWPF